MFGTLGTRSNETGVFGLANDSAFNTIGSNSRNRYEENSTGLHKRKFTNKTIERTISQTNDNSIVTSPSFGNSRDYFGQKKYSVDNIMRSHRDRMKKIKAKNSISFLCAEQMQQKQKMLHNHQLLQEKIN